MCTLCFLKTPLCKKVASSLKLAELENSGSAALSGRYHYAKFTSHGWSFSCIIEHSEDKRDIRSHRAEPNGQLVEICQCQWQATVHWFQDFGPHHATGPFSIWVFVLFAPVCAQFLASLLWKIDVQAVFWFTRLNIWWFNWHLVGYLSRYNRTSARPFQFARPYSK